MTVEPIIVLWRSISPLFQGLSVAVKHILTLKFSHCFKTFFQNSPPWSTKLFLGYPKTPVQCCNTFLTINSFFFVIYHVTQPIFFHYETTHLSSWLWFHFNFQPEYWSWFMFLIFNAYFAFLILMNMFSYFFVIYITFI